MVVLVVPSSGNKLCYFYYNIQLLCCGIKGYYEINYSINYERNYTIIQNTKCPKFDTLCNIIDYKISNRWQYSFI